MPPLRLVLAGFAALFLLALPAAAQEAGGKPGAYTIGGIKVDIVARTAEEARAAGFREAQRRAWPQLWAQVTGQPPATAPRLGDGALDGIVAAIEVQGEKISATRYIATLGVAFDRARAADFFTGTVGALQSPPMLLLPVLFDGGVRFVYEAKTPWVAAWLKGADRITPIDYVFASGSAGDNVLLNGYQSVRPDRELWRNIMARFRTVDVLTAEAHLTRLYPGGPVDAVFIARHGPDAIELGRFALRADSLAGLPAMLDAGVAQVDAIYAQALRDGRLRGDPTLGQDLTPIESAAPILAGASAVVAEGGGTAALVATPDAAAWVALESAIRAVPGVTGVTLSSLSLGGSSRILVAHLGSVEQLAFDLDQAGLRLVPVEGGWMIRAKQPWDAPVPRPAPPDSEPAVSETGTVESDAPTPLGTAPDGATAPPSAAPPPVPPRP